MTLEHVVLLDRSGYGMYKPPDGRPFLDPARYEVTLVTHPDKVGSVQPGEVTRVISANVLDEQAMMDVLPELMAGPPVHRVVAVSERLVLLAARFREILGVPGFS